MADEITDLTVLELPYRRRATLKRVDFDSGMSMVRLVLREGTRITQVDLDADSARALSSALADAAQEL